MNIKHLEVKTYDYLGIKVMVQINYDMSEISLIEKDENTETSNG